MVIFRYVAKVNLDLIPEPRSHISVRGYAFILVSTEELKISVFRPGAKTGCVPQ